jgi:hypothetical protein
MVEEELLELEMIIRGLSLLILFAVLVFVSIAYYRTRIRRLLVLFLLAGLLGINILLDIIEHLEAGVPFFGIVTSTLELIIAFLLLATVVQRFKWQPR